MYSNEKIKLTVLIIAGILMVLVSVGSPGRPRKAALEKRRADREAQAILKNCVPGTQVNLPTLENKISFLCFLDIKTGLLDNLGPVSIPKPVAEDSDTVRAFNN